MEKREDRGASEDDILVVQTNLSATYAALDRDEEASQMDRDVYCARVKLDGEEHEDTLRAAVCYASSLNHLQRFEEAKSLLCKVMPMARRVLSESHEVTLKLKWIYAEVLYKDDGATLDDLREAVTTLEEIEPIARRVFSDAHPVTEGIEDELQDARDALHTRGLP